MSARALLPVATLLAAGALWLAVEGSGRAPAQPPTGTAGPAIAVGEGARPRARAVLRLRKTRFGRVIHEERSGLVAYLFTRDGKRRSRCYGACARAWPPIKTGGRPKAGSGLKQKHLGTTRRRGGARMVTYRGRPLYFYEHDSPGQILCHDVAEFGGRWFVVERSGDPA